MKDRLMAVAPMYSAAVRDRGWEIVAVVHDEIVFQAPDDGGDDFIPAIVETLQDPAADFRVPIRAAVTICGGTWG